MNIHAVLLGNRDELKANCRHHTGKNLRLDPQCHLNMEWDHDVLEWLRTHAGALLYQPSTIFMDAIPRYWIGPGAGAEEADHLRRRIEGLQARLATLLADTHANAV